MDLFESFFGNIGNFGRQQQQQQSTSNKPPPASSKAMSALPNVQVTADDLLEETNKECAICLDDQQIGHKACKLPCGHLFHRPCVLSWLEKQCTCPTCRFELETSDPTYEIQRKSRMQSRKLRMRIDELQAKKVSDLRTLCRSLQVDISTCVDKRDIIEKLQESGRITITEGAPTMEIVEDEFHSKTVSELKHLLLTFGLSTDGALEKAELRNRLLNSGRVVLVSHISMPSSTAPSCAADVAENATSKPRVGESMDIDQTYEEYTAPTSTLSGSESSTVEELLRSMTLTALRQLSKDHNVPLTDCIDREDVIQRLLPHLKQFEQAADSGAVSPQSYVSPAAAASPAPTNRSFSSSATAATSSSFSTSNRIVLSREVLAALPLRELRGILHAYDIDTSSCLERPDLLHLLERSPEIQLVD